MTAGPAASAGGDEVAKRIANQAEIPSLFRRRTGQVNRQVGARAKIYLARRPGGATICRVLTGEAPAT